MEKEATLRKFIENATMAQILGLARVIGALLGEPANDFLENSEDLQVLKHNLGEWGDCLRDNWKRLFSLQWYLG